MRAFPPAGRILSLFLFISLLIPSLVFAAQLSYLGKNNSQTFEVRDVKRVISNPTQSSFIYYRNNPVITGHNIYAPSVLKSGSTWYSFQGGFKTSSDLNDDIFLTTTTDDSLQTGWTALQKIVDNGSFNHVNDPSVVIKDGTWYMAFTTATYTPGFAGETCALLTSTNGTTWPAITSAVQINVSFPSTPTKATCARPSLIRNAAQNRWEMYFDGSIQGISGVDSNLMEHVAYATGAIPQNFVYQQALTGVNVASSSYAVDADVKLVNGTYIIAYRNNTLALPAKLLYATSLDGRAFTVHGDLLTQDPFVAYDDGGITEGGWVIDGATIKAFMAGGTSDSGLNTHKLGLAFPQTAMSLWSGSVGHIFRRAINPSIQQVETFTYNNVDRVKAVDVPGGPLVIDQTANLVKGDVISLVARTITMAPRTGANVSSTAPYVGLEPNKAFDSNPGTFWSSDIRTTAAATEWYALDIGVSQPINGLRLTPRSGAQGFPQNFQLQTSTNGTLWTDVSRQVYTAFPAPTQATVDFIFDSQISARYVRVLATKLGMDSFGNYYLQIAEVAPLYNN